MKRYVTATLTILFLLTNAMSLYSYATANSPQYFAVYRDGVASSTLSPGGGSYDVWHAGYVYNSSLSNSAAVLHQVSDYQGILGSTLSGFVGSGRNLIGYYRPNQFLTTSKMDAIQETAEYVLANTDIDYCYIRMLGSNLGSGPTVEPSEIDCLRCDGFIEYIYEKNNVRVFGDDGKWNISVNTIAVEQEHTYPDVHPRIQAVSYMKTMLGDLDASQGVTAGDANNALKASAGMITLNTYQTWAADVDGDGTVESSDARFILRYSAHLETRFPAEPTL